MNAGLGAKLILNYSGSDHKGFDCVCAAIIKNGQPALLTDWSGIK